MTSLQHEFAPLKGETRGFTSTPVTSPVHRRRRENRRFEINPVACSSRLSRLKAKKKLESCLVSNSLSYISFHGEELEPESEHYWATNEMGLESIEEMSYCATEPNIEIMKERILLKKAENVSLNSSSDEDTSASGYKLIRHYKNSSISYLSMNERYARIDDENIDTSDEAMNNSDHDEYRLMGN